MDKLRFRQIHLDYHTSELIENIGEAFDPEEFANTLKRAHVNSVTLFARCHHGMIYYDSHKNPERIHPHLKNKDLLKQQIAACKKVGIRTPIYTSVQWDYYSSQLHRDWVCIDENGQGIGESRATQLPKDAGFYDTLCINTPYREFFKEHVGEILDEFDPVDGFFLDIVNTVDCMCPTCKRMMLEQGYNPISKEERMAFYQKSIDEWQEEMTSFIKSKSPDATIFYNYGHVGVPQRKTRDTYTHFEVESLPSGIWGYLHFPTTVRYARNLGMEYLSHTGKFHTMWGDFNSYKNQAALEFECFHMLAMGAKCMIGDQLNPDGRLTPEVYDLIGAVFSQVEEKEPWCNNITPVVEIGVLTPEEFFGATNTNLPKSLQGAVRILQESALQFDVLDSYSEFEKYRLIILPDEIPVDQRLADKLDTYMKNGGKVIFTSKSGLKPDGSDFALDIGVKKAEDQPKDIYGNEVVNVVKDKGDYCQYVFPGEEIGKNLHKTYYVMYTRGLNVTAKDDGSVLMNAYSSTFDRDYRHFCSHRQSPCSGEIAQPAVVKKGNSIYFSHPIFMQYHRNAPLWCKKMMQDAIDILLEKRIIEHNGPSSLIVAVNDQKLEDRRVLHMLHYIPERRCEAIDVIEDVIPLYHIKCRLEVEKDVAFVTCQPQGESLSYKQEGETIAFEVPVLNGHQMVEIKYKEK